MWPSMQRQHSRSPKRKAPPKPNILSKPSLKNPDSIENIEWTQFPADEFHAEKIALEKWLDSDDTGPTVAPIKPPMYTIPPDSCSSNDQPHNPAGFDDDFSDFVLAPAPAPEATYTTSKGPIGEVDYETKRNQDPNDPNDELFSDDFLSTDQEILIESHRIFGPLLPSQRASSSKSGPKGRRGR